MPSKNASHRHSVHATPATPRRHTQAMQVREDIEHSLRTRRTRERTAARSVEDGLKSGGTRVWRLLKSHPYLGTMVVGGAAIGLAATAGVGEVALGALAAYAAYQVFKGRETPSEVARELIQDAEHGL